MRPMYRAPIRWSDLPTGPLRAPRQRRGVRIGMDPRRFRQPGGHREHCPHCKVKTLGVLRCMRCGRARP